MASGSLSTVEEALTRTIGAIYDAAVAPDRWPDALRHLKDRFGTGSTAYVMNNADRTQIDRITAEIDPEGQKANVDLLLRGSPAYAMGTRGYAGQIVRIPELIPDRTFQRSRMYQEYWRPRHLAHALRLTIAVSPAGHHHAINLIRPKSGIMFEDSDIALAQVLMPQLQRAVVLRQRLNDVDMLAAAALSALDVLRHAILVLDQNGRVLHANASGDSLLRDADGLGARDGYLFAASQASTGQLHAVLARAAVSPVRAGALRLRRPRCGGTLALLAIPFARDAGWSLSRRPAVLVCVTDPDVIATLPGKQLSELFGLTAAEAALAADLLSGHDLREIAEVRGRSVNTVRTHLAKLMAKTNVNRQSDLMRLLARLPGSGEAV